MTTIVAIFGHSTIFL